MTDVFQAEYDVRLLKDIQESVESLYEDGQPLHYLESAMSVDYDPNDARVSSIFVVDCAKFKKMQGPQIQDIFKHRHILVHGVEVEDMAFDEQGLSSLGGLHVSRTMHGKSSSSTLTN